MNDRSSIVTTLKTMLADEMELDLVAEQIDASVPLLEDGLGLDSIFVVELIAAVEQRFQFEFEDSDLREANFQSLNALAAVIESKTS